MVKLFDQQGGFVMHACVAWLVSSSRVLTTQRRDEMRIPVGLS